MSHFPLVEEATAEALSAVQGLKRYETRFQVSATNDGKFVFQDARYEDEVDVHDLVPLACRCDEMLFGDLSVLEKVPSDNDNHHRQKVVVKDLADRCTSAPGCTVSLMLGLNKLETCIRDSHSGTAGRAPLLKNMLNELSGGHADGVLQCLLLPSGLNLRNLVWHGFVGASFPITVLRPWVALVLALILSFSPPTKNVDALPCQAPPRQVGGNPLLRNSRSPSVRCRQSLQDIERFGRQLEEKLRQPTDLASTIPKTLFHESFWPLWDYSITIQNQSPAIVSVVWTVLLEHALRTLWCESNGRPEDLIARSGHFYVTLDGHGQRDKHDVLLHYFRSPNQTKNALYPLVGPHLMTLCTDLFISGAGGPNIRSALAHGIYDQDIESELRGHRGQKDNNTLRNMLLLILQQTALARLGLPLEPCIRDFKPLFSQTATTSDSLDELLQELAALHQMTTPATQIAPLPIVSVESMRKRLDALWPLSKRQWSLDCVYEEATVNERLLSKLATRALLLDTLEATRQFTTAWKAKLSNERTPAKQLQRLKQHSHYVRSLYSFSTHLAILHLESDEAYLVKIVTRTRMVVSTVSTFIHTSADRAYKAADTYAQSKAVQNIVRDLPRDWIET